MARLFYAVVAIGAVITAPSCGGVVEKGEVVDTTQRDGQGGSVEAGSGGVAPGGSSIGGGSNGSGRGGTPGTFDATGGSGNRDAMLDGPTVGASFDAADGAYATDANRVDGCVVRPCPQTGLVTECGDCIDNDNDGQVDANDPECVDACNAFEQCPNPICPIGWPPCGLACLGTCPAGQWCDNGCCDPSIAP